ncbi:hypothetical protein JTB14_013523 [Gonioctena quinquepunctata]|nr:hypothetical protein JTB14_013523 [Gonioctena quinquepunctata]
MLSRGEISVNMATAKLNGSLEGKEKSRKTQCFQNHNFSAGKSTDSPAALTKDLPITEVVNGDVPAAYVHESDQPAAYVKKNDLPSTDVHEYDLSAADVHKSNPLAAVVNIMDLPPSAVSDSNLPTADYNEINLTTADYNEINLPAANISENNLPADVDESGLLVTFIHKSVKPGDVDNELDSLNCGTSKIPDRMKKIIEETKITNQEKTVKIKGPHNKKHRLNQVVSSSAEIEKVQQEVTEEVQALGETGSDGMKVLVPAKRKYKKGENVNPNEWAKNSNAAKRRKGKKYFGLKKQDESGEYKLSIERDERKLKDRCGCKNVRHFKCDDVTDSERTKLFNTFWKGIDTWEAKRATIVSLVEKSKPIYRRGTPIDGESRKNTSLKYYLKVGDGKVRVCSKMFLNTLCLGERSVHDWVKKSPLDKALSDHNINENINCIDEFEKITENTNNTLPLSQKRSGIRQFFDSLPKMESHYCRSRTSKHYLEPVWESKSQIYNEYKRICLEKNDEPASRALFTKIFFSMNIGFFIPKKDQCETCIKFKLGKVTPENYERHQMRKFEANDKIRAEESSKISVYAIDVQKVMTCPDIKASVAYYKTKLKIHNWSVFNLATHDEHATSGMKEMKM